VKVQQLNNTLLEKRNERLSSLLEITNIEEVEYISRKQRKIVTSNRKWYVTYRIVAIPTTLRDLQGRLPVASLFKMIFCTSVQQMTRFQLI